MYRSLSIIIPNYNGEQLLQTYMPSVLDASRNYKGEYEIIIIDDQSVDNSLNILTELQNKNPEIKVICNYVNLGFSGTCNAGIKIAKGDILFFLNTDVKLSKDFFHYFNNYFEYENTFAVTVCAHRLPNLQPLDGIKLGYWKRGMPKIYKNIFNEDLERLGLKKPYSSFSVQGAYFFADAKKTLLLGGFDELFSPYIFEETDLSYRALKRGWKIYYDPLSIAYHAESSTINRKKKKNTLAIATKNKLIFVWKNIHSKRLLISHFIFLGLRLLSLNLIYWKAFRMAIKDLDLIKEKRAIEKKEALHSDEVLFKS